MAKGAAQQESLLNNQASTQLNNANSLYQTASKIIQSPGYTPQQVNTQLKAAQTPIAAQTASAATRLANRSATSHNTAGLVAGEDELARTGASAAGEAGYKVQAGADQAGLQERDRLLGSLYAPTLESSSSLYGDATKAQEGRTKIGVSWSAKNGLGASVDG